MNIGVSQASSMPILSGYYLKIPAPNGCGYMNIESVPDPLPTRRSVTSAEARSWATLQDQSAVWVVLVMKTLVSSWTTL